MKSYTPVILLSALLSSMALQAQETGRKVAFHGNIQSDVLFPEEDDNIGTGHYDEWGLTNTYADLGLMSRYVDAGFK